MKIIKEKLVSINSVVKVLEAGGVVIYPTETVYGIGVDATNTNAVNLLNSYKKRPLGKPYSIAVCNKLMAQKYVFLNEVAENLYNQFLPGPLTIVSKGKHILAKGVESEYGSLGVRVPNYKLVLDIIKKFGKPITATSANASYQKRPYKISDILDNISQKQKTFIDLIIDAETLPPNEPSTVIDTTLDDLVVLRQGNIQIKDKLEVLSRSEENTQNIAKELWQKYEKYFGKRSIIFALEGQMGSGKTQFTKGLAKAMGIMEEPTSPTFALVNEYFQTASHKLIPKTLVHIDSWRMQNSEELVALGFSDMLKNKCSVIAIEWADRIVNVLREHAEDTIIIWVKISYGKNDKDRLISWGAL
jgi:L-threonylcarbamoyladenylate synthase